MWSKITAFFKHSETIFWARLQVALGALAAIITYVQPEVLAPIMPEGWLAWAVVVNGVATEYLRRRRANLE